MKMNQEQLEDLILQHSKWRALFDGMECKTCGYMVSAGFLSRDDQYRVMANHVAWVIKAYEDKP